MSARGLSSRRVLQLLRAFESPNITFIEPDGSWPIVWERARDVWVWDAEGRKYLDLTAAFGVAAAGHANPRVVKAGQRQMTRLLHAMGDVHPHARKAQLARELSRVTFERWSGSRFEAPGSKLKLRNQGGKDDRLTGRTIFCNSGFEAVEAALKTALLATGKRGVIAFEGAYHGLGYGALNVTHREYFRSPFRHQLREFAHFVPFPKQPGGDYNSERARADQAIVRELDLTEARLRRRLRRGDIGAILVEPVQVRGGIQIPPLAFLALLRRLCDEHGALLVADEIYSGFGRTGRWFAVEHSGVIPDLICLGKALTGGFPLSACVGRAGVMEAAWPASRGEAIHTSTFLGHPVGCAMALAQIEEIKKRDLVQRSARLGELLLQLLQAEISDHPFQVEIRGLGLMAGMELRLADGSPATEPALRTIKRMLRRGFILLPEGADASVIAFTPSLTINERQLRRMVNELARVLRGLQPGA